MEPVLRGVFDDFFMHPALGCFDQCSASSQPGLLASFLMCMRRVLPSSLGGVRDSSAEY